MPVVKTYCIVGNLVDRECTMNGIGVKEDCSYTLNTVDRHAVVGFPSKSFSEFAKDDMSATLRASGGCLGGGSETSVSDVKLRRLTPLECERLQGLPDNWSLVDGASDSARYKAIGNGMAQPCADFILTRIAEQMEKDK